MKPVSIKFNTPYGDERTWVVATHRITHLETFDGMNGKKPSLILHFEHGDTNEMQFGSFAARNAAVNTITEAMFDDSRRKG